MSKTVFDTGNSMSKTVFDSYRNKFNQYVNDDLDMPKVLALVWEIIKDDGLADSDKKTLILDFDKVLGLQLDKIETFEIPENVKKMIEERDKARAEKDFAKSDELRKQIESFGFEVMDTSEGTEVTKK